MYIPFEEMAGTSRVWIYQANRSLSALDKQTIKVECEAFLAGWAAHGQPLKSSYHIYHDKFLVISVDESVNLASGCSIDASVALIKSLSQKLTIDFFDRSQVCFLIHDEIVEVPLSGIKLHIAEGKIKEDTLTFNNLVSDIRSLQDNWEVEAKNSWVKRYFG